MRPTHTYRCLYSRGFSSSCVCLYLCIFVRTDRAEVCVKASELDAASDRLAAEQRRARELQWEVERERSRADRRAEGEREALEVSHSYRN